MDGIVKFLEQPVTGLARTFPAPGEGLLFAHEQAVNVHAVAAGAGAVWVGCCRRPSLLLKVSPDLKTVEPVLFPAGSGLHDLAFDGRHLWVAHASGHVTRLEPETGRLRSQRLTLAAGRHPFLYVAHHDGETLWLGTYTDPGRVLGLDPRTWEVVEHLLPEAPMWSVRALAASGDDLWAGLYTVPGRAVALNKASGNHRVLELGPAAALCTSGLCDGRTLWLGLDRRPARVLRIDPVSGAAHRFSLHAKSSCVRALVCHGGFLWLGLYTSPAEVVRLDPGTGAARRFILPEPFFNTRAMVAAGDTLWISTQNVRYQPSGLFRFSLAEAGSRT